MYDWVLAVHSLWRWVVVLSGVAAVGSALSAYRHGASWDGTVARNGRLFAIAIDIQFLLGASLYLVFSPITTAAMSVASGLPEGSELRFFGVYHGLLMSAAFVDVHLSAVAIRRGKNDRARLLRSVLLYSQTLCVIFVDDSLVAALGSAVTATTGGIAAGLSVFAHAKQWRRGVL